MATILDLPPEILRLIFQEYWRAWRQDQRYPAAILDSLNDTFDIQSQLLKFCFVCHQFHDAITPLLYGKLYGENMNLHKFGQCVMKYPHIGARVREFSVPEFGEVDWIEILMAPIFQHFTNATALYLNRMTCYPPLRKLPRRHDLFPYLKTC